MIVKYLRKLAFEALVKNDDDDDDTKTHVVVMPAAAAGRTIESSF